jgi:hypothetical protein
MGVMIDESSLDTQSLGLRTVGDVLGHVARDQRLVVNITIDGESPDLEQIDSVRKTLVRDHVIFMETVSPFDIARDVLDEVDQQLRQASDLCDQAVSLLRQGTYNEALKRLGGCLSAWGMSRDSLDKITRLLKLDLDDLKFEGQAVTQVVQNFANQLNQLRVALESRDYVELADVLSYDMKPAAQKWSLAIESIRESIE